jgi:hypothetical protein
MFVVTEEAVAAIRAVYEQEGELSAAIEVRRLFPGITDNAKARECHRRLETAARGGLSDHPLIPLCVAVNSDVIWSGSRVFDSIAA